MSAGLFVVPWNVRRMQEGLQRLNGKRNGNRNADGDICADGNTDTDGCLCEDYL